MNKYYYILTATALIILAAVFLYTPKLNPTEDGSINNSIPIPVNVKLEAKSEPTIIRDNKEVFKLRNNSQVSVPVAERVYTAETNIVNGKPNTTLIIETNNTKYKIPLKTTKVTINDKLRLNPKLTLGIASGIDTNLNPQLIPSTGISFFNNSKYAILNTSIGYDLINRTPILELTPIARTVPFLDNTQIGLSINTNTKEFGAGITIKVKL
jgi:hypothetical protein